MDNSETLATQKTQDTGRRQTKQKQEKKKNKQRQKKNNTTQHRKLSRLATWAPQNIRVNLDARKG